MDRARGNRQHRKAARRRNSDETRAAILGCAEKIFAEAGLAGARTEAIAAAAGVNKAMLYYYFGSKAGLYGAVLEANVNEFHRQAEHVLASQASPGTVLLRYVGNHFDFIGMRPYYPRLFQRLVLAGDRQVERIIKEHFLPLSKLVLALIERGMSSGEFRTMDARHTAMSLVALTVFDSNAAPVIRLIGGTDVFDRKYRARRKEEVLKFIRYALFKDPEAARPS